MLYTSAGSVAAVRYPAGPRLPHHRLMLVLPATVGVLAALVLPSLGSGLAGAGAPSGRHGAVTEVSPGAHLASLLSLPAAAQAQMSAALGRDQATYRIHGLVAHNPAQGLVARFGRSGVTVTAGSKRFAMVSEAFGRLNALRALLPGRPAVSSNRATYALGPVREWWANGPLGLEQGFDIAQRPAGSGPLTLSLAVTGRVGLDHGTVLLPGGLRYAGLRATDVRGRSLRAWLQVRKGRIFVLVNDRGAHYPLQIDPFVEQAELSPSDGVGSLRHIGGAGGALGSGDQFGWSVATSGHTVVVGAPYHAAHSQAVSGALYVFRRPAVGWANATQTAELTDSTLGAKRELGFSVAISSDGHTIVAGAPAGSEVPGNPNGTNTQGTVDVFTTTGRWTSTGSPAARLTVAGSPATESTLGGELGWSVAISGHTIVSGTPYDPTYPSDGAAYVFNQPPGGWSGPQTQTAELTEKAPPNNEDEFGSSVGISGNTIVIGAPRYAPGGHVQGAAFVFTGPWSGNQTQTATLTASDASPTAVNELGLSVAVSGKTVVAGAPYRTVGSNPGQGAVYVFVMPTVGPWVSKAQTAELTAPDGRAGDAFGWSVAVAGHTVVAGANARQIGQNDDQGAAFVYTEPSGGWKTTNADTAELTGSDGDTDDSLGASVAVSGTTVVAGAPRHNAPTNTADFGEAYVFGPGPATVTVGPISASHAEVMASLSCPAGSGACAAASLEATAKVQPIKQAVVASGGVTLSAGTKKTLTLNLNSTGRALLSKLGKLTVVVTISSGGKTIKTVTTTLLKAD